MLTAVLSYWQLYISAEICSYGDSCVILNYAILQTFYHAHSYGWNVYSSASKLTVGALMLIVSLLIATVVP